MRPIYYINTPNDNAEAAKQWAETLATAFKFEAKVLMVGTASECNDNIAEWDELNDFVEQHDVAILIFQLNENKQIQPYLNYCRELRVPYLFVRDNQKIKLDKIALPVTFLMEEKEKGPFASAFGRFFKSEIIFFVPNDYGSKAKANIAAIAKLFDSFNLKYTKQQGKSNSEKIELEAALKAPEHHCGLVIVTASREYGLDDIIFGPKERKILKKSILPVMLINPRGDLYTLCD
ncbi:MAG: hypothetical protein Q4D14_02295 [Bacteroidales bacterium]|nr:hypothetical protein [Bacteroidales bacterium]